MSDRVSFPLVLLCFLLSGFAALLYETVWTREFAFVFGTSELAVVSVLAAYMGGLAAGAAVAARLVPRVRRPVLVYGLLELGIALCALAVPFAIRATTGLYVRLLGGLPTPPDEGHLIGALFHLGASFLILLPPTALMGATLPLLARHAVRREDEIGRRVGMLYAVNTAGAVAGTLVAAFALLPVLGLRQTVYVGAAVNALVFFFAATLARGASPAPAGTDAGPRLPRGAGWVLPAIGLSGLVSFTYEVLWTRLLGHLLGGSLYAFATMLASFLLGIAVGSALAARLADRPGRAGPGFAVAQLGAAGLSVLAFVSIDALPGLAGFLGAGIHGSPFANAVVAGCVLLPPALCIGATFPFAVRLLAPDEVRASAASARLYAANTVGAIAGAVGAGFLFLPAWGYAGTLALAVGANLVLAIAAALLTRAPRAIVATAIVSLGALALLPLPTPWSLLRASPWSGLGVATTGEAVYYAVGRSATVLVREDERAWRLSTNGLPEAAVYRRDEVPARDRVVRWLGLLPVLAKPSTKSLLLIGLGGGAALEAIPSTVDSIDVIELEPEVVTANRTIAARRGIDPLDDPRVSIRLNDARGALQLCEARWDAIVSQPSHPWTAGASHLYTREFFALVRQHLAPGGVFVQWIGLRYVDERLLRSLVATLSDVFPAVRLYQPNPNAVLFVASEAPIAVESRAREALAAAPADFARFGITAVEDVAASLVLDEAGVRAFGSPPLNRDDDNLLAMGSARIRGRGIAGTSARRLLAPLDPLPLLGAGLDGIGLVRRVRRGADEERASRVARRLVDPLEAEAALAWIDLDAGRPLAARRRFAAVLEADPNAAGARFGLLRTFRRRAEADEPSMRALAAGLTDPSAAVVEAWRASDPAALRELEPRLAAATPLDPAFADATRLRAGWRIESGERGLGDEALAIADLLLVPRGQPGDYLLRARAGIAAERPAAALSALELLARRQPANAAERGLRREAFVLVDALPPGRRAAELRAKLGRER